MNRRLRPALSAGLLIIIIGTLADAPAWAYRVAPCRAGAAACVVLSPDEEQALTAASSTEQLRTFMMSHLRSSVASLGLYRSQDLPNLGAPHREQVATCLRSRERGGVGRCLGNLPSSFPEAARTHLRNFARQLQVAGIIYDVCESNSGAVCPPSQEFTDQFNQMVAALDAPGVPGGMVGGQGSGSVSYTHLTLPTNREV